MTEFKQERLKYLANVLTEHCHINVPCILGNEQVQQLPEEILTFVRDFLKEHTRESKKD